MHGRILSEGLGGASALLIRPTRVPAHRCAVPQQDYKANQWNRPCDTLDLCRSVCRFRSMVQPRPAVVSIMADGSVMVTTAGMETTSLHQVAMLLTRWLMVSVDLVVHPLLDVFEV